MKLPSATSVIIAGVSGVVAVKASAFLRSIVNYEIIPGYICGSGSIGNNICRFGSVGKIGIPLCAERIDWIQPLKPAFTFLGAGISYLNTLPNDLLGFKEKSLLNVTFNAIGEELFCRGLIQHVLVRNIQAEILEKLSTNHEILVNHPIAKITRIAAASIVFGLLHTPLWECGYGGTIPQIAGGVIFGTLAETNCGLISSTLAHITANLIVYNS